ncbi:PPR32 phosphatase, partial [Pterocles burchelli]|nr:PPR32 phosphatase [Pterocles burchelli]
MASACPFVCPRGKLRSLPQGWPAVGLGTRGSADLMNFYATTSAVAHGHPRFRPRLGHHTGTGFVSNERSAVRSLLCPRGAAEGWVPLLGGDGADFGVPHHTSHHSQDTATSTTAEHFQPLWVPDGRSLLPRRVPPPESGYLQDSPLTCLRAGPEGPQNVWSLQDPPKASGEHGTGRCCTTPAYPDILQKSTIGAKELSGFTKATPRTHRVLPALPGQPV